MFLRDFQAPTPKKPGHLVSVCVLPGDALSLGKNSTKAKNYQRFSSAPFPRKMSYNLRPKSPC